MESAQFYPADCFQLPANQRRRLIRPAFQRSAGWSRNSGGLRDVPARLKFGQSLMNGFGQNAGGKLTNHPKSPGIRMSHKRGTGCSFGQEIQGGMFQAVVNPGSGNCVELLHKIIAFWSGFTDILIQGSFHWLFFRFGSFKA